QLYDPERRTLRIVAQRGFQRAFLDHFAEVDAAEPSSCGIALSRHERVIFEDVETAPGYAPSLAAARDAGYRAVQSTPLFTTSGEPLGMVSTHFRAPHAFTEHELKVTDLFARELAHTLERSRIQAALRKSEATLSADLAHMTLL